MKNLLILGASKNGADLTFIIDSFEYLRNEWRIIGYLDDNDELNNKEFCGHPVLGKFKDYCKFSNDTYYFLSPGSPSTYFKREKMVRDLDIPLFINYILNIFLLYNQIINYQNHDNFVLK